MLNHACAEIYGHQFLYEVLKKERMSQTQHCSNSKIASRIERLGWSSIPLSLKLFSKEVKVGLSWKDLNILDGLSNM